MKKYLGLFLAVLIASCSAAPSRTVTTTQVTREVHVVLHADKDLALSRNVVWSASKKIESLTQGRGRVQVVFDLDFDSISNLKEHVALHHSTMISVSSKMDIAKTIDGRHNGVVVAETDHLPEEVFHLVFISDRILPGHAEEVVMHEFGHVLGFNDLSQSGAVMSGFGWSKPEFTSADFEECRKHFICK